MPREIIKVFGERELGVDLLDVTRIIGMVGEIKDPEMNEPPELGLLVQFGSPQTLSEKLLANMEEAQPAGGKKAYTVADGEILFVQFDEKTFMLGTNDFVKKMMSSKGASSTLITMMKSAPPTDHLNVYMQMEPVRSMIKSGLPPRDQVPPPFRGFLKLPDLVDTVTYRSDFSSNDVEIIVGAIDEKSAKEVTRLIAHGFDLGKNALLSFISTQAEIPEEYQEATLAYAERVSVYLESAIQPKVDGKNLTFNLNQGANGANGAVGVATVGVMIGMLLPAVQQVREAARRTDSSNRLRQFAIAAHNYESTFGHFPMQANYDEDGKPLLSWRVHMLPFLEQQNLYDQFRLNEPWDSPHNIQLLDMMPAVYRNPNIAGQDNKTVFLGVSGEGTIFAGNKKLKFSDIPDGLSNTAMFVEADESHAVEWTKPADWNYDGNNPLRGLGGLRPAGFNCAFADGSSHVIQRNIDPETWKNIARVADGNAIDNDDDW